MRYPRLNTCQIYRLKQACMVILFLNIVYECLACYLVVSCLRKDLHEAVGDYGQRDETWRREFFKSSRNFFVFSAVLSLIANCMGLLGAHKQIRVILAICVSFMALEWGFEMIGIYFSQDWRIALYKMACQALRPLVFLISAAYCLFMESDTSSVDQATKQSAITSQTTAA